VLSVFTQDRFVRNLAVLIIASGLGAAAGTLIPLLSGRSGYRWILVAFVAFLVPALFLVIRNVSRTLLFAFVFALPFGFAFTPFGDAPYHEGGAQPVVAFVLYDFPLIGLTVSWLLKAYAFRTRIGKSSVVLVAILWIAWSILSLYNSLNRWLSVFEILRMVKLCILMLVVSDLIRERRDVLTVLYALLLGMVAEGAICAVQYATGSSFNLGLFTVGALNRVSGTIGWPNTLGAYAAAITSMALTLFLARLGGKIRAFCLIAGFAGLFTLVVSFSRGAWIAFLTALVVGVLVSYSAKLISFRDLPQLAVILLVAGICIAPLAGPIGQRLAQTSLQQGAIADRFVLNQIAFNMIAAHPVLGVGINTFVDVMTTYDKTGLSYFLPYPVHNVYLLIAAETGLIGLALFAAFVVAVFRAGFRGLRSRDRLVSASAIGITCSLTAILVSNLADVHLRTDVLFALLWFGAGFAVSLGRENLSV